MVKNQSVGMYFSCGAMVSGTTMAAEPGSRNYPAGSPGIFLGKFPPISSLFMISQTSYTTADAFYDSNGDEIKEDDFKSDVWVETLRFIPSYPGKLWGANLYSQVAFPIVFDIDASLSIDTSGGTLDIFDDSDSGLGNITVSLLIMNWQERNSPHYYPLGIGYHSGGRSIL